MGKYKKIILIVVVFIAFVGIGFGVYYFSVYNKLKKPEKALPLPKEVVTKEQPSQIPLKKTVKKEEETSELAGLDLDKSDDIVRKLVKELSSYPQLAVWLTNEDLIRRFTAVVDNIATGFSPRPHIEFLAPKEPFQVIKKGKLIYINPTSYKRYNLIVDVFTSLDTEGCVKVYKKLKPLFQKAYQELGYPTQDFQDTLFKAIIELLKTPIIKGKILLERKVVTYKMVDPKLEQLSPAQKHLIRMGPENVRKIQAKLREIALALGIPENQLPPPRIYSPSP